MLRIISGFIWIYGFISLIELTLKYVLPELDSHKVSDTMLFVAFATGPFVPRNFYLGNKN
jgi:hypothetical protein